jgi:hypothetical protein
VFASYFYQALAFGRSVQDAFELGKNQLELQSLPGWKTTELLVRKGVNASQTFLIEKSHATKAHGSRDSLKGSSKEGIPDKSKSAKNQKYRDQIELLLERILAGKATVKERQTLQHALISGKVVFTPSERDVAAEEVEKSFLILGSKNQLRIKASEAAYVQLREQVFPRPSGIAPPAHERGKTAPGPPLNA